MSSKQMASSLGAAQPAPQTDLSGGLSGSLGEALGSAKVREAIQAIVHEVGRIGTAITNVRDAQSQWIEPAQALFDEVGQLRGRPLHYPYISSGVGRGAFVELIDGSRKLDLINGIGINIFGHSHPQVIAATLRGALSDVVMQGNLQPGLEYVALSRKLVNLAGRKSRLKHAWLATCGAMANENALKIVRQKKSPARMIIAMKDAFAGRSTMMAEITDNPSFKQGLPEYHEVLRVPFCNRGSGGLCESSCGKDQALRVLKEHVAKHEGNICCFTFEPMLGEGGYRVACPEYFLPMLEFCRQKGIPIWADEVQTFTRTGEFFAFETLGFADYVDVVTIAKTAQNGATLYTEEFNPKPGLIAGTFSGSSASLSAGLEILEMLDQGGYMGPQGKVRALHQAFVAKLNQLNETTCKNLLREAGGMGLMVAVTPLDGSSAKVQELLKVLFRNGLMAFSCGRGPYRLRFLLPAILTPADIELAGAIIEKSILEMS